jgi:hypothetical protein
MAQEFELGFQQKLQIHIDNEEDLDTKPTGYKSAISNTGC